VYGHGQQQGWNSAKLMVNIVSPISYCKQHFVKCRALKGCVRRLVVSESPPSGCHDMVTIAPSRRKRKKFSVDKC